MTVRMILRVVSCLILWLSIVASSAMGYGDFSRQPSPGGYSEVGGAADVLIGFYSDSGYTTLSEQLNLGDTLYVRINTTPVNSCSKKNKMDFKDYQNKDVYRPRNPFSCSAIGGRAICDGSAVLSAGNGFSDNEWYGVDIQCDEGANKVRSGGALLLGSNAAGSHYIRLFNDSTYSHESLWFNSTGRLYFKAYSAAVGWDSTRSPRVRNMLGGNSNPFTYNCSDVGDTYECFIDVDMPGFNAEGFWYYLEPRIRDGGGTNAYDRVSPFYVIDDTGPTVSGVAAGPNPTEGSGSVTVNATIDDRAANNATVNYANYTVYQGTTCSGPVQSTGVLDPADGVLDSPVEKVTVNLSTAGWALGNSYTVCITARDMAYNYGGDASVTVEHRIGGPPTAPDNIECNGSANCNILVDSSVGLNASGSVDPEGDDITYYIEASLQKATQSGDLEPGAITKVGVGRALPAPANSTVYGMPNGYAAYNVTGLKDNNKVAGWAFMADSGNQVREQDTVPSQYTNDADLATSGRQGLNKMELRDRGTAGTNYLRIDTGLPGGTPLLTDYVGIKLFASDDRGDGTCRNDPSLWSNGGLDRIYMMTYLNATDVNSSTLKRWDTGVNMTAVAGPVTPSGCITEYVILNITSLYKQTPSGVNFTLRVIGDEGDGLDTSTQQPRITQVAEVYLNYSINRAANETNTSYTTYGDTNTAYRSIDNITVTLEVDSYNPEASVKGSTAYPDLSLEMYNGSGWVFIGSFGLPATYTGTGPDTTNHNFTLIITDPDIFTPWRTPSNQDLRIRGVHMDYINASSADEINYTSLWVTLEGVKWTIIGNHTALNTLTWSTASLPEQNGIELRARAIDLNGSRFYSSYFTKGAFLNISRKPEWSSLYQNSSAIHEGASIRLGANWSDDTGLGWAWLETNESGVWENKTGVYGSPMDIGMWSGQSLSDFTWQNSSVPVGAVVSWRIWANDTLGNLNVTDTMSFSIACLYDSRDPNPPSDPGNQGIWFINPGDMIKINGSGWSSGQEINISINDSGTPSSRVGYWVLTADSNGTLNEEPTYTPSTGDPTGTWTIEASSDGGSTWTKYDTFTVAESSVPEFPVGSAIVFLSAAAIYGLMRKSFQGEKSGQT